MAPLGPDMTTASLIAAVTPEGDVETGVEEPAAWLKWKSEYTEEEIQRCVEEAHKPKQFPSIIEPGSEFHVEFLFRHFTRLAPDHRVKNANKAAWKAVIRKHLDVLSDTIGKMNCGPFKFQTVPGAKPCRQRMYPLSMVKKDALAKCQRC